MELLGVVLLLVAAMLLEGWLYSRYGLRHLQYLLFSAEGSAGGFCLGTGRGTGKPEISAAALAQGRADASKMVGGFWCPYGTDRRSAGFNEYFCCEKL